MNLADIRTDAQLAEALTGLVAMGCETGRYGANRRGEFRRKSRAEKRNRKRLEWVFGHLCRWYRADGNKVASAIRDTAPEYEWTADDHKNARAWAKDAVKGPVFGLFLSWVAGWLIELAVGAFVNWLLSPDSANWRENPNAILGH